MAKRKITVEAWADVGSHGGIFIFEGGRIAQDYPTLMQVFHKRISPSLIPVKITYEVEGTDES